MLWIGLKKICSDKGSNEVGKGILVLLKLVWVVVDKDKFGNLIDDIFYFIVKFNEFLLLMFILFFSMVFEDISSSGMIIVVIECVVYFKLFYRVVFEGELVVVVKVIMVIGDIVWLSCFLS